LAPDLLIAERMSPFHKKIVEVLEGRTGVVFAEHSYRSSGSRAEPPSSNDWEQLMECVAAAFRTMPQVEDKALYEAQVLVGQFVGELKKIDESLKVVSVFLERLRQQLGAPEATRIVH
jgi:hypothetical protein